MFEDCMVFCKRIGDVIRVGKSCAFVERTYIAHSVSEVRQRDTGNILYNLNIILCEGRVIISNTYNDKESADMAAEELGILTSKGG